MDAKLYEDPPAFNPSRFLNKPLPAADYINTSDPYDRDHFTYGAGRRVCPGVHVAERSIYINVVRTLWAFDIGEGTDEAGNTVKPDIAMNPGFLSVPKPFKASIKVRSSQRAKVIREAFQAAEAAGIKLDAK